MQQRQLRLGDILDDYCPRERRVTNHAVVAMIGRRREADALHHVRRGPRVQARRRCRASVAKSETPAALYAQVLATGPETV